LVVELTRRAVHDRYRASHLGLAWTVLSPLLLLAVYTTVFGLIVNTRPAFAITNSPYEFGLVLFAALIPFSFFSEAVGNAPYQVVGQVSYVKRVVFPLHALPLVSVLAGLVHAAASLGLFVVASLLVLGRLPVTALTLPLVWTPLILITLAFVYTLAALGVFLRDLAQVVGLFLSALFFLSPVFYPASALPEALRPFYWLNPIGVVVENSRRVLVVGLWPEWRLLAEWAAIGALATVAGFALFVRLRAAFNDVL
jgi:lipopolysaccharide transport system permease protein